MKLRRDLSSDELVKAMARLGYLVNRQTGSHIRLTTQRNGEHHVTNSCS
jgi:predicted RNA binding protein YcfA (HicA-like mRNA interferase family)